LKKELNEKLKLPFFFFLRIFSKNKKNFLIKCLHPHFFSALFFLPGRGPGKKKAKNEKAKKS
jgi:hypothetical protein